MFDEFLLEEAVQKILAHAQRRQKWNTTKPNLKVNELVLVLGTRITHVVGGRHEE